MSDIKKRRSFLPEEELPSGTEIKNISKSLGEQKLKYRAEQKNTTRIEDEVKSFSEIKKQFTVNLNLENKKAFVKLTDLYYDFKPPIMGKVYEFVSETEYIRNNVNFNIDKDGRLHKITNKEEVYNNWLEFKNNKINELEFIKTLKNENSAQYKNILLEGDKQFASNNEAMENDYHRDLLYLVLFDKHLTAKKLEDISQETYMYKSQLLPQVQVPMEIRYDVIDENEKSLTIRKVAEAIVNEALVKQIEEQYNTIHKPLIKYSFTEYKLTFRVRYNIEKLTRIINDADLTIIEDIEHNIQSVCKYNLKKL